MGQMLNIEQQSAWSQSVASARNISSSFYWPIRMMPKTQREAMWVLYAFCHTIDAITDGEQSDADKYNQLQHWRENLGDGAAQLPLAVAFQHLCTLYNIPAAYPLALIDASIADVREQNLFPSEQTLDSYCYGVASVVGLMTVRILGVTDASADAYAIALGQAFQRTNMLRDVLQDAEMGRCYLPREWIEEVGLEADCEKLIAAPEHYQPIIDRLAAQADAYYAEAARVFPPIHNRALRPTVAMRSVYEGLHEAMRVQGFVPQKGGYKLAKWQKLWRVSRTYLKAA